MTMRSVFLNLTPHALNVRCEDGSMIEIPPSGTVARVATTREFLGAVRSLTSDDDAEYIAHVRAVGSPPDVQVFRTSYGDVEGLPDKIPGRWLIVSAMVRAAVPPNRTDVLCPGEPERDESGKVIGCKGLSR